VLEKGAILKIPGGTMFQPGSGCKQFTQIMIKTKNPLKCFSATGSYHKINGRQKSICNMPVKIKSGTKITFLEGEYEGLFDFKMFQENNLFFQYVLKKGTEGVLI
jgi:hypothetical protein